jgi:hypothetical protein
MTHLLTHRRYAPDVMAAVQDGDTVECSDQETADWLHWQMAAYKDTRQITITVDESWKDRRVSHAQ